MVRVNTVSPVWGRLRTSDHRVWVNRSKYSTLANVASPVGWPQCFCTVLNNKGTPQRSQRYQQKTASPGLDSNAGPICQDLRRLHLSLAGTFQRARRPSPAGTTRVPPASRASTSRPAVTAMPVGGGHRQEAGPPPAPCFGQNEDPHRDRQEQSIAVDDPEEEEAVGIQQHHEQRVRAPPVIQALATDPVPQTDAGHQPADSGHDDPGQHRVAHDDVNARIVSG